jgi:hypothetical protein
MDDVRNANAEANNWTSILFPSFVAKNFQGQIRVGMTCDEVLQILPQPDHVQRFEHEFGVDETWSYADSTFFINFSNGIVESTNSF